MRILPDFLGFRLGLRIHAQNDVQTYPERYARRWQFIYVAAAGAVA